MNNQPTKSAAFRVLEERIEELETENESLREEKDYFENIAKKFRDTLSDVEFDDDLDFEDDDQDLDDTDDDDDDY